MVHHHIASPVRVETDPEFPQLASHCVSERRLTDAYGHLILSVPSCFRILGEIEEFVFN